MEKYLCCKCKVEKEKEEFTKNSKKVNGINNICKFCHSIYRKQHYLQNKEKVYNQVRIYRTENPEKYLREKLPKLKVQKDKNNGFSKKAGRKFETKCCICESILYRTKAHINSKINCYCSYECRSSLNKSIYHHYLRQVNKRALKYNKEFNLDEVFIKDLLEIKQNNLCNITNIPIKIYAHKELKSLHNSASLDRIDSSKGYTKDNVQWVCLGINYMKLDYNETELHEILKLIKENYTPQ